MRNFIRGLIISGFLFTACNDNSDTDANGDDSLAVTPGPPVIPYSVTGTLPHDTLSFTEGLEFYNGELMESSGPGGTEDRGQSPYPSGFGIADIKTGKFIEKVSHDKKIVFGEGITVFNDKIYHLTYENKVGYVYDAKTYKKLREFPLPSAEGWGLTHDSSSIIMSAGTSKLFYIHPDSLTVQNIVTVINNTGEVSKLNELEYVDGYIYANEWLTNNILKIEPSSGKVVGRLDLSAIAFEASQRYKGSNEMNGIAYDKNTGEFLVTGKNWPLIYKIKF